jgi:hypothetical protein
MHSDRAALLRALIFIAVFAVFARLCTSEFTWYDEAVNIHQNPLMNPPTLKSVAYYWTAVGPQAPGGLYIPLTYTLWSVVARLTYSDLPDASGIHLNPWAFHTLNVLLHALATVVVFNILRLLLRRDWAAALGAMIFAVHPIQVEAVGWIAGTKDVLCGLLCMVTVWQWILFRQDNAASRRWIHYAIAVMAFVASMLAKPTGMVTSLIVLALDLLILRRGKIVEIAAPLGPWFVLSLLCAISTRLAQPPWGAASVPIWQRPLIALDSLAFYLVKLIVPIHFAVDYGRTPGRVMQQGIGWMLAMVPVLAIVFAWRARKRHPLISVSVTLFIAGLAPVLGFVPFLFQVFSGVTDHYVYISMLGVALACATSVTLLPSRAVASAGGVVIVLLSILAFRQTRFWHDDFSLWTHAIQVNPRSYLALTNRGAAFFRQGKLEDAEDDFRAAIELNPAYPDVQFNLGLILERTGRAAEAAEHFRRAIELNPTFNEARDQLRQLPATMRDG